MNFKMKLLSSVLASSMLLTCVATAFAAEKTVSAEEQVLLYDVGHGQYAAARTQLDSIGSADPVKVTPIDLAEDIYVSEDNQSFLKATPDIFLEVDQIDVNLYDMAAVESFLATRDIPEEEEAYIRQASQNAIEEGNELASLSFYTPQTQSLARADQSNYYTQYGWNFRDDLFKYTNFNTGFITIASGTRTNAVMGQMKQMSYQAGTFAIGLVPYVGTAISVLDLYITLTNAYNFSGSASDYVQVKVTYDATHKYTYADSKDGYGYRLSVVTQHAVHQRNELIMYATYSFSNGGGLRGEEKKSTQNLGKEMRTPNYNNPAYIAYTGGILNTVTEKMTIQMQDKTFHF